MRRALARIVILLLVITVGAFVAANAILFRRVFWPTRFTGVAAAELLLHAEKAPLGTSDGVKLEGSFLKGRSGAPAIVFCHDRGQDRTAVLRIAILLHRVGYSVLAFDFRGHGESGAGPVTLGIREREDVLAAVAYLRERHDVAPDGLGVWGMGMGAYAALLAAPEAKDIEALALNFLYADARDVLRREFEGVFRAPMGMLEPAYLSLLDRLAGSEAALYVPEKFLGDVTERQVLLVVSADDDAERIFVEDVVYPKLDPYHRTLLRVPHRDLPVEGGDREGFELNTVQFFKHALPLP